MTLEDNNFTSLEDLPSFADCVCLNTVVLKRNRISEQTPSPKQELSSSANSGHSHLTSLFEKTLNTLDLSHNMISSWTFVDDLTAKVSGLQHLRISNNPLYEQSQTAVRKKLSPADVSMLIIARLPNLKTLNYSTITDKERLNAETYYLSLVAEELIQVTPQEAPAVISRHPQYRSLCEEYGDPRIERKTESKIDTNSLAARLIRCSFYSQNTTLNLEPWTTEIPKSYSIYTLLGIVGKHFAIPVRSLKLIWETGERDPIRPAMTGAVGLQEWDSEDEEEDGGNQDDQWVNREVELVAGTRPLGTIVESAEARIRVEEKNGTACL